MVNLYKCVIYQLGQNKTTLIGPMTHQPLPARGSPSIPWRRPGRRCPVRCVHMHPPRRRLQLPRRRQPDRPPSCTTTARLLSEDPSEDPLTARAPVWGSHSPSWPLPCDRRLTSPKAMIFDILFVATGWASYRMFGWDRSRTSHDFPIWDLWARRTLPLHLTSGRRWTDWMARR